MVAATALTQGRQAYERQSWAEAQQLLRAADSESPLEAEDLERAGHAEFLIGHDEAGFALLERAFNERMAQGDPEGAALDGFWLFFGLFTRGESARAGGWLGKARGALEALGRDSVAHGYLMAPDALRALTGGDAETAYALFSEQRVVGERFADHDLLSLAGFGRGQALVMLGRIGEGMAVLDEVMVGVTGGQVRPVVAGLVYCGVIAICMNTFDIRRAQEWTTALTSWCDAQPDLVPFRGQCMVHRAQIMRLHGNWGDALDELQQAAERFAVTRHPAIADAFYEQGELHRLRGDAEAAEEAYRQASVFGRDTQPGLALLRLGQRQVAAASAGIRRALDENNDVAGRPSLLSAAVEIALRCDEVGWAREAADELRGLALGANAPLLHALSAQSDAEVLLAEGDARGALASARRAWSLWQNLDAPYGGARARVVAGLACGSIGDHDAARMELDAARQAFEILSAGPDLQRVDSSAGRSTGADAGLTPREIEVLRLVATGKTNRAIAGELFLSEKTVARHVSNIFTKLGLSSRAAATAYAFQNDLV
jgi:DNA-binding CsgD family transcriptional regulator